MADLKRKRKKTVEVLVRGVSPEVRNAFKALAAKRGRTMNSMLKDYMRDEARRNSESVLERIEQEKQDARRERARKAANK